MSRDRCALPRLAPLLLSALAAVVAAAEMAAKPQLDAAAERWMTQTRSKLTLDEQVGQLIVPSLLRDLSRSTARANTLVVTRCSATRTWHLLTTD